MLCCSTQRTLDIGESITVRLVNWFTSLYSTASLHTNNIFSFLIKSSLDKLETSRTVILPPLLSILCSTLDIYIKWTQICISWLTGHGCCKHGQIVGPSLQFCVSESVCVYYHTQIQCMYILCSMYYCVLLLRSHEARLDRAETPSSCLCRELALLHWATSS